jgi:hypothetical protein
MAWSASSTGRHESRDIRTIQKVSGRLKDFSPEREHNYMRADRPCRSEARGTWPVNRRSTMETLIFAFVLTVIAILVLADATVAATNR